MAALAETPVALPHLHVPMQSGDDAVLRAMRRRAPAARYAARIAAARAAIDGLNVTADVIVGFPAEDDAAFGAHARAGARDRPLARPRVPVLAAAGHAHGRRRSGAGRREARAARSACGRVADAQGARSARARVGSRDRVLVERVARDGTATGYARDYTPWRAARARAWCRVTIVEAVATGADDVGVRARTGMRLSDRVREDRLAARKARDADRVTALGGLLAALEEAEKSGGELSEQDEIALLRRERKRRDEARGELPRGRPRGRRPRARRPRAS